MESGFIVEASDVSRLRRARAGALALMSAVESAEPVALYSGVSIFLEGMDRTTRCKFQIRLPFEKGSVGGAERDGEGWNGQGRLGWDSVSTRSGIDDDVSQTVNHGQKQPKRCGASGSCRWTCIVACADSCHQSWDVVRTW